MDPISTEELHLFHKTDREVFCLLIIKLRRDIAQSLLVMGLWLWLEHNGYPDIIHTVMGLPNTIVDVLVNEAVSCLNCLELEYPFIPDDGGLPLTTKLTQKDISLQMFTEKRYTIVAGIKSVLKNICARIFADVLQIFVKSTNTKKAGTSRGNKSNATLVVPGFPHPLFGTFDMPPKVPMNLDLLDERIWTKGGPCDDVADDDKSMFLTFSRGFPVSELEVQQLFTYTYGDCVQSLSMGTTTINTQPLYAILILKTVATVDEILKGKRVAKLQVNGKHIWARKYERRD